MWWVLSGEEICPYSFLGGEIAARILCLLMNCLAQIFLWNCIMAGQLWKWFLFHNRVNLLCIWPYRARPGANQWDYLCEYGRDFKDNSITWLLHSVYCFTAKRIREAASEHQAVITSPSFRVGDVWKRRKLRCCVPNCQPGLLNSAIFFRTSVSH